MVGIPSAYGFCLMLHLPKQLGTARRKGGQRASAAVELAMVGGPLVLLLMATFDITLMSFRESSLRAATAAGARVLRTGEVAAASDPQVAFVSAICGATTVLDCGSIIYDVRPYQMFGSVSFTPLERDEDGNPQGAQFVSGTTDQILGVRLMVRHSFVTPFMAQAFGASANAPLYLESTMVVRGEPWGTD